MHRVSTDEDKGIKNKINTQGLTPFQKERRDLLVFAKAPRLGQVKTRLINRLGEQSAADLHQQLVKHCLQKFSGLFSTQLWCAPDEYHPFFQTCQAEFGVSLHPQIGNHLGERMAYALASSAPAVLIGSDCPSLTVETIDEAFAALQHYPVVLAPAEDGGYVLIGLQQVIPELFIDIPWGSSQVLTLTRETLQRLKLPWHALPTQWDIDRPDDLERWYETLKTENENKAISDQHCFV